MIKKVCIDDIVEDTCTQYGISKKLHRDILTGFIEAVKQNVEKGFEVSLFGLGTVKSKWYRERVRFNAITREPYMAEAVCRVVFKGGKWAKEASSKLSKRKKVGKRGVQKVDSKGKLDKKIIRKDTEEIFVI